MVQLSWEKIDENKSYERNAVLTEMKTPAAVMVMVCMEQLWNYAAIVVDGSIDYLWWRCEEMKLNCKYVERK